MDQLLAQENVGDKTLWLLGDHQNSTQDIVWYDAAAGASAPLEHLVYDAYGKPYQQAASALTRYMYTGREYDGDTKLQYNRARWYDPNAGRWISEDPIGFAAGDANLNRYVGNGPTSYRDPFGLEPYSGGRWNLDGLFRWLYTGDANAPDDVYEQATIAAGAAYLQHGGDAHQAFDIVSDFDRGILSDCVDSILTALEGEDLHLQVMQNSSPWLANINQLTEIASALQGTPKRGGPILGSIDDANDSLKKKRPGSPGHPDHKAGVEKDRLELLLEIGPGERVKTQKRIEGHDSTRIPDNQIVGPDNKTRKIIERERRPTHKRNCEREAEYDRLEIPHETRPVEGL
ncbi:MAG: RHS repeat-associated core domain-containing protein [Pirellulales bacterium]|nr:RHS repeat-associated core domain-containing protein [Pirellulales bacterium]